MRIIREISQLAGAFRRPVATIGNFDGVHSGHLSLLRMLRREADLRAAEAVLMTFDPHPLSVLAPDRCPPLIQTLEQKLELFAGTGLDGVVVYPFSIELSLVSAEDFVRDVLIDTLGMSAVAIGAQFSFGHRRRGNIKLLQEMGAAHGFEVIPVMETEAAGQVVSSTRIRQLLLAGEVEEANQLLGRSYAIDGRVVGGMKLGKKLGFPTANVDPVNTLLIPNGVYAASLRTGEVEWTGAASLGIRPTIQTGVALAQRQRVLEVHLFECAEDLYDRTVRVNFHRMVRPEYSYPTLAELVAQIERDVDACKHFFDESERTDRTGNGA
jgi:riboflavin kinase/FMN adenylyltransferase